MKFLRHDFLKKNKMLWLITILSIFIFKAEAEDERSIKESLGLSGSLRLAGFEIDKSGQSDYGHLVPGLWLKAEPKQILGVTSFFEYRVLSQTKDPADSFDDDLREAYVEKSFGHLDVKAGRFVTVWGKADKINPTDVFSTRNYNLLMTDDEDQRLGIFSTQFTYNFKKLRLIGIWQPEWRQPVYPIGKVPSDTRINYGLPQNREEQFGLKLDYSETVDLSLSFSRTIDRNPDFNITPLSPSGSKIGIEFNHINVYGIDAAVAIGEYGLRAEVAFTDTSDKYGKSAGIKNENIYSVIGIERTLEGVFNINLQYLYKQVLNFKDPDSFISSVEKLEAKNVAIFNNQLKEHNHGATLRLNLKSFQETLESEVAIVNWFIDGNYGLYRPKITYAFTDSFHGAIGYERYYGVDESLFGRLKDMSTAFIEVRMFF